MEWRLHTGFPFGRLGAEVEIALDLWSVGYWTGSVKISGMVGLEN